MRVCSIFILLLCALTPGFSDPPPEDVNVSRARSDMNRVQALVESGVLPRARLLQAQDAVADTQDDAYIRTLLYKQDITVGEADQLVDMTNHRVGRRQGVVEAKKKLVEAGILARDEMSNDLSMLAQAQSQSNWALSRRQVARELSELVRNEQEAMQQRASSTLVERFVGSNRFDMRQFASIEKAFDARFAHPLPVSAMGETEVHRSMGFDHRNRVDIALPPDLPEGRWLRTYLAAHNIPYFAFRSAVAHQATGAHIHIGPPSLHYYAQAVARPHTGAGED